MSDAQEEAEAERRRAKELENELRTSRLQAEIDKLRALEMLREKFDAQREQLRDDRAQDGARFKEWKDTVVAEREVLTEQVRQLKEELTKARSKSRSRSSSELESGSSESHTPEDLGARTSSVEPARDPSHEGGDGHTSTHEDGDDHTHEGSDDPAHREEVDTSTTGGDASSTGGPESTATGEAATSTTSTSTSSEVDIMQSVTRLLGAQRKK